MSWIRHAGLLLALCGCLAWIQWQKREIAYYESVMAGIEQYAEITRIRNQEKMAVLSKRNGEIDAILARNKKRMNSADKDLVNRRTVFVDGVLSLSSGDSANPKPTVCNGSVADDSANIGCSDAGRIHERP